MVLGARHFGLSVSENYCAFPGMQYCRGKYYCNDYQSVHCGDLVCISYMPSMYFLMTIYSMLS